MNPHEIAGVRSRTAVSLVREQIDAMRAANGDRRADVGGNDEDEPDDPSVRVSLRPRGLELALTTSNRG